MGGIKQWAPYQAMVQGGMPVGDHASGMFVMLAAGPPLLSNMGGPSALGGQDDVVYPIGLTQNVMLSSNKQWTRIFEIGSDRSFFIPGRTVSQMSLSRIYYNGPSLLRCLAAYYSDVGGEFPDVESLWDTSFQNLETPFMAGPSEGGLPKRKAGLHDVKIPPGFGNIMINLASDLFSQSMGLLMLLRSSEEQNLSAYYLEQCVIPAHSFAFDAQGLVIQESCGIQFERMVPIPMNSVATLRGLHSGNNPTPLTLTQQSPL